MRFFAHFVILRHSINIIYYEHIMLVTSACLRYIRLALMLIQFVIFLWQNFHTKLFLLLLLSCALCNVTFVSRTIVTRTTYNPRHWLFKAFYLSTHRHIFYLGYTSNESVVFLKILYNLFFQSTDVSHLSQSLLCSG